MSLIKMSPKGYTLIEVLVAVFIFALATSMVSVALIENNKNQAVIKEKSLRLVQIQRAMTLIANDLVQAGIKLEHQQGRYVGSFFASAQEAQWIRRGHINPAWTQSTSSLRKVHYTLDASQLIRNIYEPGEETNQGVPILDNVQDIAWTYYDKEANSFDLWPPVQTLNNTLPSLVRVQIELEDYGMIERVISLPVTEIEYEQTN